MNIHKCHEDETILTQFAIEGKKKEHMRQRNFINSNKILQEHTDLLDFH